MMGKIRDILSSKAKPKEKVSLLAETIRKDKGCFQELIGILKAGSDVEKGTCADVMKHVSKDRPEIVVPYIGVLVEYVNYKAPRVKWGIPESIGNMAQKYPKETEKAIPSLLENTKDESTVVRWCAAFALSEIAKHNAGARIELMPKIKAIAGKEKNNGVRTVYAKALKNIEN